MGNQDILPGFATVTPSMSRGAIAPENGSLFFGQYVSRSQFVLSLWFEHVNAVPPSQRQSLAGSHAGLRLAYMRSGIALRLVGTISVNLDQESRPDAVRYQRKE